MLICLWPIQQKDYMLKNHKWRKPNRSYKAPLFELQKAALTSKVDQLMQRMAKVGKKTIIKILLIIFLFIYPGCHTSFEPDQLGDVVGASNTNS